MCVLNLVILGADVDKMEVGEIGGKLKKVMEIKDDMMRRLGYHDDGFDVVLGEFDGVLEILRLSDFSFDTVKGHQLVHHVRFVVAKAIAFVPPLVNMFVDDFVYEYVQRGTGLGQSGVESLGVDPAQVRDEVRDVERSEQL